MSANPVPVALARGITYDDWDQGTLADGTAVDAVLVHQRQIEDWLLKPAARLDNHDDGFAQLVVTLTFFEAHGQYLAGCVEGRGKSRQNFRTGWKAFCGQTAPTFKSAADTVYDAGRCGLFHSALTKPTVMLDPTQSVALDDANGILRICPSRLLEHVCAYFKDYLAELRAPTSQHRTNFETVFEARTGRAANSAGRRGAMTSRTVDATLSGSVGPSDTGIG